MRIESNRHAPQMGLYHGVHCDGLDYHILYDAAQEIKGVEGLTCELGTRRGGGSAVIIQACLDNEDKRIHVGVDAFGNIEFPGHYGRGEMMRSDYTNKMKQESLPIIYKFCEEREVEFLFMNLDTEEFFTRYADGIPIYNEYKYIINKYAFVYFDVCPAADGSNKLREADFFQSRAPIGAVFVFDDISLYNHEVVHNKLLNEWGFELIASGWKAAYKKVK